MRSLNRRIPMVPLVSLGFIAAVILLSVLAPVIAPYPPLETNYSAMLQPPSSVHLLGTDELGRDVFSRLLYGGQSSLLVAALTVVITVGVAAFLGAVAALLGGKVDWLLSRVMELGLAFPVIVLAVGLAAIFSPNLMMVVLVISITGIPSVFRVFRGSTISLREAEYIEAVRIEGADQTQRLWRHILPNLLPLVAVQATLILPATLIGEATLSYLGLGVQLPDPTWGNMLSGGQGNLATAPWLAVVPGVCICLLVLAISLSGDWLRDRLDSRSTAR